ncbi:MAG: NAD-dependent glycerol-3-phosphate dehydrogenase N-terminus [Mycobacterium sp.]|nr:NAD-dependent glycerol-3-phosphate dehydrogenase N-terminus [Mycobacterium sp.]
MAINHSRRIAVVGSGLIGSALAGHLILAGNTVTIGARRPEAFTPPDYQREDIDYHVCTVDAAIDGAEVTILAIPNAAVAGFADQYRDSAGGCNHHRPVQPVPVARRRGDDHQGPRR